MMALRELSTGAEAQVWLVSRQQACVHDEIAAFDA